MSNILALDIGGTNPRIAMMNSNLEILKKTLIDKNTDDITEVINDFLKKCSDNGLTTDKCCISVAGVVKNNSCENPTNSKIKILDYEIKNKTMLKNVLVINDFEAIGYAVSGIDLENTKSTIPIPRKSKVLPIKNGNRAVIGPGTGLGVTYLYHYGDGYRVSASEGGHAILGSIRGYELLFNFIREEIENKHLDFESLVSGNGIRLIMKFCLVFEDFYNEMIEKNKKFKIELTGMRDEISDSEIAHAIRNEKYDKNIDAAKLISESYNKNKKARITMKIFFQIFGHAATSVALNGLTTGGLFIAGGIPSKNKNTLISGDFTDAFETSNKDDIRDLLKSIPIYLVDDYDISFRGCAKAGITFFGDN